MDSVNILQLIAPYVTNPWSIWGVVCVLVIWAAISSGDYWLQTGKAKNAFKRATKKISAFHDSSSFALEYEKVSSELASDPVLGSRWREYRLTLDVPIKPGRPIHSTARAEDWFNLEILRSPRIGIDPRYHAVLPNLFVGAGLLFTFLGLAVALSSASGIVEGSSEDRNKALKGLLDAASFKFITSLAGLFLSVAYTIAQKGMLRATEKALDAFLAALESLTPALSSVTLQIEANRLMEDQLSHLQSFSNDLAVGLSEKMDTSFNNRLAEHIEPLTSAISRLSERMEAGSEDTLKSMLDNFVGRLQSGAGAEVNAVAKTLSGLGDRLDSLQSGFSDAAVRMVSSAEEIARRMSEGAEASTGRLNEQIETMVAELRELARNSRLTGEEAMGALSAQISAAACAFEAAASRVSEGLEVAAKNTGGVFGKGAEETVDRIAAATEGMRNQLQSMVAGLNSGFSDAAVKMASSADAIARRMSEGAEANTGRLNRETETMLAQLSELARSSRLTGEEAMGALTTQVGTAAGHFEATATRVSKSLEAAAANTGGVFGKGAEEAVDRIAVATEGMRNQLQSMMADLKIALGQAGQNFRDGSAAGGAALQVSVEAAGATLAAAVTTAADRLTLAGATASIALERGGDLAAEHLGTAGKSIGEHALALAQEITALARAGEAIAQRFRDLDQATRDVIIPLAAASSDLKAAGQHSRLATEPLLQSARNSANAIDQLAVTAQRLETAGQKAGNLIESLDVASLRFQGVDRELGETLKKLEEGLRGFTNHIATFTKDTDKNLAQAAGYLSAVVKELHDTIQDFNDSNLQGEVRKNARPR